MRSSSDSQERGIDLAISTALHKCAQVAAVIRFGSRVLGRARGDSDIDIAVLLTSPPSREQRYAVISELLSLLAHQQIAEKADLVLLNDAPVALAFRVLKHGRVVLCRDDVLLHRFRVKVYDRHADYAWVERLFQRATLDRASRLVGDG
jgi:predicted nucleotidyltransferase